MDYQPATSEPRTLEIKSKETVVTLKDVLVGEVWIASGQSNMEFIVANCENAAQEIATANFPLIRQFDVPNKGSLQPEDSGKLVKAGKNTMAARFVVASKNGLDPVKPTPEAKLEWFEIAGADGKFVWADAIIAGPDSVVVSSPGVASPTQVRYSWANNPAGCNLYNTDGLPASPFRTPLH